MANRDANRDTDSGDANRRPDQSWIYAIRIEGQLGGEWSGWFAGLTITLTENGHTILTGPVVDQAALYGLLKKVRDLGAPLVSVVRVAADHSKTQPTDQQDVV